MAWPIWAALIRDPSLSPSRRQPSPLPGVILGRVIQLPPGAASQGVGGRASAAGILLGQGHCPLPQWPGEGRSCRDSPRGPLSSPVWGWKRSTGDSPSCAVTHCLESRRPPSRDSASPMMSKAQWGLNIPGRRERSETPCSGSR